MGEETDTISEKVMNFLQSISLLSLADCAYNCGEYARSLMYYEKYVKERLKGNGESELQELYSRLQLIYSNLDEPDSILGISTKIIHPTIEQRLLEHQSLGDWEMALNCYELMDINHDQELIIGRITCLKNLGQLSTVNYSLTFRELFIASSGRIK